MKVLSRIGLLVLALSVGIFSHAQTPAGRYDNFTLGSDGKPAAFATVRVCAWSAAPAFPCTPLSSIYSDFGLTAPQQNPFTADALGNFGFNIAPGRYTVQLTATKLAVYNLAIVVPCDPTICGTGGGGGGVQPGSCTNQAVTALNLAGPTCTTLDSSYVNNSIAVTGGDINTSSQVVSTHITGGTTNRVVKFDGTRNLVSSLLGDSGTVISLAAPFDFATQAAPANPSVGSIRLYADSSSGNLTCLTSAGANCIPSSGGGGTPGGSSTAVQFNSAGSFAGDAANFNYNSTTHAVTTTGDSIASRFVGSIATVTPSATPVFNGTKTFNTLALGTDVTSSTITSPSSGQLLGVNICSGAGNHYFTSGTRSSVWPTGFPQSPVVPFAASSCLDALFWNNAGNFTLAAEPHTGAAAIRWVSPNGSNANDGLTLATAFGTVGAAYDSLPATTGAGGIIYVDSSTLTNGGGVGVDASATQGLWICGGGDPSCTGTLPAGWRSQKGGGVKIIGVGQASTPSNSAGGGMATVFGCSTTDVTKPNLWLSGLSQPFEVDNVDFGHGSCAQPIKLAISMAGSRSTGSGGTNIRLHNVAATPSRASASYGPGIDIGSNLVWAWLDNIACDANTTAAVDSDNRACIVSNPGASPASGPMYIRDSTFNGAGGIKLYQGGSGLSYFVENVMMESDGVKACPPVLWILNGTQFTFGQSKNIQHADCPVSTVYPAVEIDGNPPASNNLVEFAFGTNGFHVSGQATVFNTSYRAETATPEAQNQLAWWDDSNSDGTNGRLAGQQDSARRAFGPVAVPYTNLAATFPASWTIVHGTITQGQTAPNGTTNAATVTYSGGCDVRPYQNSTFTTNVGDMFVGGVWARATSAWATGAAAMSIGMGVGTFTTGQQNVRGNTPITIISGGGEWEWISTAGKVAVGQVNGVVNMALVCENTRPVQYYGPVLLYFPAGTISANEVAALREHLQSFPTTASVKDVTTLPGTRLSFGVPNSNFFGKFTDATFTADHVFTWPNKDGTVAMTSDITSTLEQVNAQAGTTYTVLNADLAHLITFTNAGAVAVTLPIASSLSSAGWWADFQCQGAAGCTLTPTTSTIDGSSNLGLSQGQGVRVASDGTNYFTERGLIGGGAVLGTGTNGIIPIWTASNTIGNGPLTFSTPTLTYAAAGNATLAIKSTTAGTGQFPEILFQDSTATTKSEILAKTDGQMFIDVGTGSTLTFRNGLSGSTFGTMSGSTFNWSAGTITSSSGAVNAHTNLQAGDGKFSVDGNGRIITYNNLVPTDGQLLIGDTAAGYFQAASLTAGSNITITPGAHSITIASASGSGTVTSVAMTVPSWLAVSGTPIVTSGTLAVTAATGQTTHKVIGTGATASFGPLTLTTADLPFTYSGNTTVLGTVTGAFTAGHTVTTDASGNLVDSGTTGGTGTVTSFSAGTLSPLFTTSVATSTSTPALTFSLSTAAAHTAFMNNTGSTAAPGFQTIGTGDLPFTYSGNTTKLVTTTGTLTNGHCVSIDANSNFIDSGQVGCGGGGAGGTVTSVALAAPTGFTVTGSPVTTSGTLTFAMPSGWTTGSLLLGDGANSAATLLIGTNGLYLKSNGTTASWAAGGTVTSVAETFTGGLLSISGSPITTTGTFAWTVAGTSGGIPYFSSASTWASSAALTANLPVIGGGAGVAPTVGTITGNTTKFVTSTGTLNNGHCVSIDANGNFVDSGAAGCSAISGTSGNVAGFSSSTAVGNIIGFTFDGSGNLASTKNLDLSASPVTTGFRPPSGAGAAPTLAGRLAYDSTQNLPVFGNGTVTLTVPPLIPQTDNTLAFGSITKQFSAVWSHAFDDMTYATPTLTMPAGGVINSLNTGTPTVTFGTNSVSLSGSGAPVDFFAISSYVPGSPPVVPIAAAGTDTDISLNVSSKGTGYVNINRLGLLTEYNGSNLAGSGVAGIIYSNDTLGRTTAITDTTMATPSGNTVYRFSGQINCTAASASATATLTLKYTDTSNTAQTLTALATCTTLGASSLASIPTQLIRAKSAVAVTWGVPIANTPTFDVGVRLEIP